MRVFGVGLIIVGVIWGAIALGMNTTVTTEAQTIAGINIEPQTVVNLGLMDARRNQLMISGLISLVGVILFAAGSVRSSTDAAVGAEANGEATRKCPSCAETVLRDAVICRFCGRDLPALPPPVSDSWPVAQTRGRFLICPACNKSNPHGTDRCQWCHSRYGSA